MRVQNDFAAWKKQAPGDSPQSRVAVHQALRLWQRDPGLAGVRDPAALAGLPESERTAWRDLWQQVEAVLAREP